jgi:CRISPR-associated protein Cst2
VLRITEDPAPRLLYCFEAVNEGRSIDAPKLLERVGHGDIKAEELIIGGPFATSESGAKLKQSGAFVGEKPGVKAACNEAVKRVNAILGQKG